MHANHANVELDSLIAQFEALSPAERRKDIERAERYLRSEYGRREFGVPDVSREKWIGSIKKRIAKQEKVI